MPRRLSGHCKCFLERVAQREISRLPVTFASEDRNGRDLDHANCIMTSSRSSMHTALHCPQSTELTFRDEFAVRCRALVEAKPSSRTNGSPVQATRKKLPSKFGSKIQVENCTCCDRKPARSSIPFLLGSQLTSFPLDNWPYSRCKRKNNFGRLLFWPKMKHGSCRHSQSQQDGFDVIDPARVPRCIASGPVFDHHKNVYNNPPVLEKFAS